MHDICAGSVRDYVTADQIVRAADERDIQQIVSVHLRSFPGFFLSHLGSLFLAEYYASVLSYDLGILLVGLENRRIVGFAAGAVDPSVFYRTMRGRKWRYVWPIFAGVVRRPRLLARIAANAFRVRNASRLGGDPHRCELTSIAVLPDKRGSGLGQSLVACFLECAWSLGAMDVSLTTDAFANESALRFYEKSGFRRTGTFTASAGRQMHEYVIRRPIGESTI
jgi:ribosomal protein S18 acetylase RimI-like enzyme